MSRGKSVQMAAKTQLQQTMAARRRTTYSPMMMATQFEQKAIKCNTYLNVIINSAAINDLILLLKKTLRVQGQRAMTRGRGAKALTTNLDETTGKSKLQ